MNSHAATRAPCAAPISQNGATLLHFDKCSCDNEVHHLGEVIQSFCLGFFLSTECQRAVAAATLMLMKEESNVPREQ